MGWTAASKKALNKIIEMDLTKVFVEEVNESSLSVLLYKTENNKDICINGLLVKKGYAISVGPRYVMSMIAAYVSDDFLEVFFLFNTFATATIQIIHSYIAWCAFIGLLHFTQICSFAPPCPLK